MNQDNYEKEEIMKVIKNLTPKKQIEPISADTIYLLDRLLKELRDTYPLDKESVVQRYKLKSQHEILARILSKGIDNVIDEIRQQTMARALADEIENQEGDEEDAE